MRFRLTEEEERFQQEVSEWCEKEVPAQLRQRPILGNHYILGAGAVGDINDADYHLIKQFTLKLGEKGWLRIGWPEEYGGMQMTPIKQAIVSEELRRHRGWQIRMGDLPGMIITHGTKEQKDYWLPPLGRGELATCLVLSEPDAGSDMANCKCRAVLEGDHFIVNGMKHYVSQAHRADYGQLLVLTDSEARKRHGLSRFICDMHAPGVTVRPMLDMAGEVELNEVWFDDVRIPKDCLIGTLNGCWLEMNMDAAVGRLGGGTSLDHFESFIDYCKETYRNGKPLSKDPGIRRKLAQIAIDHEVMTQIGWQELSDAQRNFGKPKKAVPAESVGGGVQSVGASTLPMISKEWNPRFAQAVMEIMGPMGLLGAGSQWAPLDGWAERHYRMRGFETHAHGTIEVLKMVVATRGLGLPRGPGR